MLRTLFLCFISVLGLVLADTACAEQVTFTLSYDQLESFSGKVVDGKNQPRKDKSSKGSQVVTLQSEKFSIRNGNHETVYDFARDKMITINHEAKNYSEVSLYAIPMYKVNEGRNRMMLKAAMDKAGVSEQGDEAPLYNHEVLFDVTPNSTVANDVTISSKNGETVITYKTIPMTRFSLSDEAVPASLKPIYSRYFLYGFQLHPIARQAVTKDGKLFKTLSYHYSQFPGQKVALDYQVTGFAASQENTPIAIPDGYTRIYSRTARLNSVIEKMKTQTETTPQDYASMMDGYFDKGEYEAAAMIFLEFTLEYPQKEIIALQPLVQRFKEAPKTSQAMYILSAVSKPPKDKDTLKNVIHYLEQVKTKNYPHGYVLNTFLGNYYQMAGEREKAIDSFYKALEQNPFLTGGYMDLGKKYLSGFDPYTAWACWDALLSIHPDHEMAKEIVGLKDKVRADFPHYF